MRRHVFKSKIHRATVTATNRAHLSSITIDSTLMRAADILPYESVHVWNITNGSRIVTYAIEGKKDSGEICINGAGARLNKVGDLVIIATFVEMTSKKAREWKPLVINVNSKNCIRPNYNLGDKRIVKQFLLFPHTLPFISDESKVETRWFSKEKIVQQYKKVVVFSVNGFPCPSDQWVDIAWAGDEDKTPHTNSTGPG